MAKPKITAKLRDVFLHPLGQRKTGMAWGYIFGDTRGRFVDGTHIRTSAITKVDGNIIHTRNSVYEVESWNDTLAGVPETQSA